MAHLINGASFGELALMQVGEEQLLADSAWQVSSLMKLDMRQWIAGSVKAWQASAREALVALMTATSTEGILHNTVNCTGLLYSLHQQLKNEISAGVFVATNESCTPSE